MAEQFVVFATPTKEESFCSEYVESLVRTEALCAKAGIRTDRLRIGGDPFPAHARNVLTSDVMTQFPDATDMFCLDDDIGWQARKVIEFLSRPEEIVAASPPMKTSMVDWPIDLRFDPELAAKGKDPFFYQNGYIKVALIPFGFVRLKRSAIAKLAARSRIFKEPISDTQTREVFNIFDEGVFDGAIYDEDGIIDMRPSSDLCWHWGEDQVFCRKWAHLEGEIWLDPNCTFTHRGRARWPGNFAKHLDFFREKTIAQFKPPPKRRKPRAAKLEKVAAE